MENNAINASLITAIWCKSGKEGGWFSPVPLFHFNLLLHFLSIPKCLQTSWVGFQGIQAGAGVRVKEFHSVSTAVLSLHKIPATENIFFLNKSQIVSHKCVKTFQNKLQASFSFSFFPPASLTVLFVNNLKGSYLNQLVLSWNLLLTITCALISWYPEFVPCCFKEIAKLWVRSKQNGHGILTIWQKKKQRIILAQFLFFLKNDSLWFPMKSLHHFSSQKVPFSYVAEFLKKNSEDFFIALTECSHMLGDYRSLVSDRAERLMGWCVPIRPLSSVFTRAFFPCYF